MREGASHHGQRHAHSQIRLGSGRREPRPSRRGVAGADMARLPKAQRYWMVSESSDDPTASNGRRRADFTFGRGVSSYWVRADASDGGGR